MSQNQNNNKPKNVFRASLDYLKRNSSFIIASSIGGFIVSSMGLVIDTYEFLKLWNSSPETKSGWVLVKINGWAEAEYNSSEQIGGIRGYIPFITNKLHGSSNLTPMIYTDYPVESVVTEASDEKDVSVLKNTDFKGEIEGIGKRTDKRNSQTLQAFLIQASKKNKPVCLFVHGIRDNEKSLFFNIIKAHYVTEHDEEYNKLPEEFGVRENKLKELTKKACKTEPKDIYLFDQ